MLWLFLKGLGFGIAVAAPVGPMALFCMRQTLARGARIGFAAGLGIAGGDFTYALLAGLGFASLSHTLVAHQQLLQLIAGLFLLGFGIRIVFRPATAASVSAASLPGVALGALLLTLANPATILLFLAGFAALASAGTLAPMDAVLTASGVFCGSLLWWWGMVTVVASGRHLLSETLRRGIDLLAGAALAGCGVFLLARLW